MCDMTLVWTPAAAAWVSRIVSPSGSGRFPLKRNDTVMIGVRTSPLDHTHQRLDLPFGILVPRVGKSPPAVKLVDEDAVAAPLVAVDRDRRPPLAVRRRPPFRLEHGRDRPHRLVLGVQPLYVAHVAHDFGLIDLPEIVRDLPVLRNLQECEKSWGIIRLGPEIIRSCRWPSLRNGIRCGLISTIREAWKRTRRFSETSWGHSISKPSKLKSQR